MVQSEKVRKEFSHRLAKACEQAGLNEHGRGAAIGKTLRVTSKAVSKWFNAESLPRQDKIYALANFLKVDPLWLQHGENIHKAHLTSDSESLSKLLSPEHFELIQIFDALPKDKADYFLNEMKEQKAYYESIFNEMLEKKKNNLL